MSFLRMFLVLVAVFAIAVNSGAKEYEAATAQRALIISVSDYTTGSGFKNLEQPTKDARALVNVFRDDLKMNVDLMSLALQNDRTKSAASDIPIKSNILKRVELFTGTGKPGDSLIIVYMGHGVNIDGKAYLCPMDAKVNWDKKEITNGISVDTITTMISKCKASSITFFCDACQDSPFLENETYSAEKERDADVKPGLETSSKLLADKIAAAGMQSRAVAMFQSCSPGQKAHAPSGLDNSVFFHFLIQAIKEQKADANGNGILTFSELEDYLPLEVSEYTRTALDEAQTVSVFKQLKGDIPFLAWPQKAAWMPANATTIGDRKWVNLAVDNEFKNYRREIEVVPTFVDNNGKVVQLANGNGEPLSMRFMFIPRAADPFYISRDKVSNELFLAFQRAHDEYGVGTIVAADKRREQYMTDNPDLPVFNVTIEEAASFCAELFEKGKLPHIHEWDFAFGRTYDMSRAIYPNVGEPPANAVGFGLNRKALPVNREDNPDVSPFGVRDMGSNGTEFTSWCDAWDREYPHDKKDPEVLLRGWALGQKMPLTLSLWEKIEDDQPFKRKLGFARENEPHPDTSFRVVIPIQHETMSSL